MPIISRSIAEHHSTTSMPQSVWSDERICLLAAAGVALVIVYGSVLPFDLKWPDALHVGASMQRIRFAPRPLVSRADLLVNVATGLPLGFFLMGALRSSRRRSYMGAVLTGMLVVSVSAILATAVEFLQVLSPSRDSSWNDVVAQTLGGAGGTLAWSIVGSDFTVWLRQLANERELFRCASRLLQLYLPLYLIMQLAPLNAVPARGAAELVAKRFDVPITLVPFAYHFESDFTVLHSFAGYALLNLPIGALAVLGWVKSGTRRRVGPAVVLGVFFVVAVEVALALVWSPFIRVTAVLAGILGVGMGAAAAGWPRPPDRNPIGYCLWRRSRLLVAAGAWTLVMIAAYWYPFDFQLAPEIVKEQLLHIPWIPFKSYYPAYASDPLAGLQEVLRRFLFPIPLGVLLQMAWPVTSERSVRQLQAIVTTGLATIALLGIGIGEVFLASGYPDVTEVVVGAIAAALGAAAGIALSRCHTTSNFSGSTQIPAPLLRGLGGQ
jgi:glycopeptide antibiotics resistance protein